MNQVYKTLPDDRPITSLHIVEDVERCPKGYIPVSKTYDQDSDADLWKEGGFFGRKCTRYLCISKTEGVQNFVVQSLCVIGDKETPPQGFKNIPKTYDSEQKAWRKRQLCYKFGHISACETAITDIIVLSRMKKAPEEFTLLGEINGLTLCYKTVKAAIGTTSLQSKVPYPLLPSPPGAQNLSTPGDIPPQNVLSKPMGGGSENGVRGADMLRPFRPAPKPPNSSYATISGYNGLEGVPFILNPKFSLSNNPSQECLRRCQQLPALVKHPTSTIKIQHGETTQQKTAAVIRRLVQPELKKRSELTELI